MRIETKIAAANYQRIRHSSAPEAVCELKRHERTDRQPHHQHSSAPEAVCELKPPGGPDARLDHPFIRSRSGMRIETNAVNARASRDSCIHPLPKRYAN